MNKMSHRCTVEEDIRLLITDIICNLEIILNEIKELNTLIKENKGVW